MENPGRWNSGTSKTTGLLTGLGSRSAVLNVKEASEQKLIY